MNKKDRLIKLAKEANELYRQALESGIADSDYYNTLRDELRLIMKESERDLVNMHSIYRFSSSSKMNRTMYILSKYVKSPYATYEGVKEIEEKRFKTYKEKYGMSRVEAQRFIDIMKSDRFQAVMEKLSFVSYNEIINLAMENNITIEDIEHAYDIAEQSNEDLKEVLGKEFADEEKANLFISLLTKKG